MKSIELLWLIGAAAGLSLLLGVIFSTNRAPSDTEETVNRFDQYRSRIWEAVFLTFFVITNIVLQMASQILHAGNPFVLGFINVLGVLVAIVLSKESFPELFRLRKRLKELAGEVSYGNLKNELRRSV